MKIRNFRKIGLASLVGIILVLGFTGCAKKKICWHPGCDKECMVGKDFCYLHGSKASTETKKNTETTYNSTILKEESTEKSSSYEKQSTVSNYKPINSNYNTKKYKTYGVHDYDNPDDYASDFAEDFAYDEFAEDSWEAYEYGYEAAYEHWLDVMGE